MEYQSYCETETRDHSPDQHRHSGRNNNVFTVVPVLHKHSPGSPPALSSPGSSLVSAVMTPDDDLGSAELEIEFKKCSPTVYYGKRMGRRATTAVSSTDRSLSAVAADAERRFLSANIARSANSVFVRDPAAQADHVRSSSTHYLEVPGNGGSFRRSSTDLGPRSQSCQTTRSSPTRSHRQSNDSRNWERKSSAGNSLTPSPQRAECMFYSDDDETTFATSSGYDVNPRHRRNSRNPHPHHYLTNVSYSDRFHCNSFGNMAEGITSCRSSIQSSSKFASPSRSPFSADNSLMSGQWTPASSSAIDLQFPRSFAQVSRDGSRKPFVLQRSLFPNVSPTIYFGSESEDGKIVLLPKDPAKQFLVWKLSSITPTLIRETVIRSGFKLVKEKSKTRKWLGTWCKHIKSIDFQMFSMSVSKVNHFPGTFHLGRKDKLWFNLQGKAHKFGDAVFTDFHPMTYVLPQDLKALRRSWITTTGNDWKMILKPPASARGNGITVINKWSQIPKSAKVKKRRFNKALLIVQQYISNPCLLFNGSKFDLRVYVLVTSFNPLRIFIYEEGLVRFASERYTSNQESLSDPFIHLTNYSINKINTAYKFNNEPGSKIGHKWNLSTLWKYLNERNIQPEVNVDHLKARINDMVIKTIISSEDQVNKLSKKFVKSRYTCYELLGFDILIDSHFKPWLLEVNISPSLRSESSLDSKVKGHLIKDMLNLVGYRMPPASLKAASTRVKSLHDSGSIIYDMECFPSSGSHISSAVTSPSPSSNYSCANTFSDDKFFSSKLGKDEKAKHFKYEHEVPESNQNAILDNLTSDDVRILIETEDEFSRRGSFHRIFPGSGTDRYMKYFNENRYYNILLNAWGNKYDEDPAKGGISFDSNYSMDLISIASFCSWQESKYCNHLHERSII